MREGFELLFDCEGLSVIGMVGMVGEGWDFVEKFVFDVVLVDIWFGDDFGIKFIVELVDVDLEWWIVFYMGFVDVDFLISGLDFGVCGYVFKDGMLIEFKIVLCMVVEGGMYVDLWLYLVLLLCKVI